MTTSLDDLFPEEQEAPAASKPRSALLKLVFTAVLLVAGSILFVLVGSSAVVGVANAFGIGLDARFCSLETARDCTSVSVGEINVATGARLPEDAVVEESSWRATPVDSRLSALVEAPADWVPPAATYEECGAITECTGVTPDSFESRDIEVTSELTPRLDLGDGSRRAVLLGVDPAGQEWISVEYSSTAR